MDIPSLNPGQRGMGLIPNAITQANNVPAIGTLALGGVLSRRQMLFRNGKVAKCMRQPFLADGSR